MRKSPGESPVATAFRRCMAAVDRPLVLAVSGGRDSMVLLHIASRLARTRIAAVATFDHGTGASARRAVRLVRDESERLGHRVVSGGGTHAGDSEAAWREARWQFLHDVAADVGGQIATAHTRDDQVETVLMRILRGSGARGLAGLYARGAVLRPFLTISRADVVVFAAEHDVPSVDDPTNDSRRYLRNRIRLDLLPGLRRVRPDFDDTLLEVAERAASVREALEREAERISEATVGGGVAVAASLVAGYSRESLSVLWPAVAARAGVTLDRRGTERLASFTINGRAGGRMQLSGGWEVHREYGHFEFRRAASDDKGERTLASDASVRLGAWRFAPGRERADDPWTATLPVRGRHVVRPWRPGDRMIASGATRARRVKRFLSDARISGRHRSRWPVVESNGVVVWIPGVRRSEAATARPGRSEVSYECEFDDRG